MTKFQDISNAYESLSSNKDNNNFKNQNTTNSNNQHRSRARYSDFTGQEWAQQYKYYEKSQHKYTYGKQAAEEFYKTEASRRSRRSDQDEFFRQARINHMRFRLILIIIIMSCFWVGVAVEGEKYDKIKDKENEFYDLKYRTGHGRSYDLNDVHRLALRDRYIKQLKMEQEEKEKLKQKEKTKSDFSEDE